jgi:ligand-binding sensor domain-containing protein
MVTERLSAYTWQWKTCTSKTEFRSMCEADDRIWVSTEGGLVAFDPLLQELEQWTNTEGLAANNATAICSDSEGRIWIGFYNGLIQRYDPVKNIWLLVEEYANIPVTALTIQGDTLFVGLDIGVSLYLISRSEVKETYRRLGNRLNPEIPVNDILVNRDTLWAGTDQGAAYAPLGFANLLDPHNWNNITTGGGLPHNGVHTLAAHENKIYIGTDAGAFCMQDRTVSLENQEIRALLSQDEILYALTPTRLYKLTAGVWVQIGPNLSGGLSLGVLNNQVWIGTIRGILTLSESQDVWTRFLPNAPENSKFVDFAIDQDGVLWCASAQNQGDGFSRFDDETWTTYTTQTLPGLLSNSVCAVTVDPNNDVWLGTWGRGVIHVTDDTLFDFIYQDDGIFAGISDDPDYVVVSKILTDNLGTVWFVNFESSVRRYVIARTPDGLWTHFTAADGINTSRIRSMTVDALNQLWIGDENTGVIVYDTNGTPTDKQDDSKRGTLTKQDGLADPNITALAADAEGTIWIGTPSGLYTYRTGDPQVIQNHYVSSDNITAIVVDGVNNIWIGHGDTGISLRLNHDYSWQYFNEDNSGIVKNEVSGLYADKATGNIYIGTDEGFSVLSTPFSAPLTEMKPLRLYPNPFIPAEHINVVIDDLAQNVSVGIYTAGGFLVQKFSTDEVPGRQILWDGTDRDGNVVASGIYLVVAKSESGEKQIGKIALVR